MGISEQSSLLSVGEALGVAKLAHRSLIIVNCDFDFSLLSGGTLIQDEGNTKAYFVFGTWSYIINFEPIGTNKDVVDLRTEHDF